MVMNTRLKSGISKFFNTALFCLLLLAGTDGDAFAVAPVAALNTPAPAFSAVTLDGKAIGSAQLAGKAYIVNFFASWCPPCRAEIPDMVALQNQYSRNGFTFIGIAVNETAPTIKSFITGNRISYPVVMSDDQLLGSFGRFVPDGQIKAIPTSFVVNASGRVTQVITGGKSKAEFEKIILAALKKPVKVK
ncbi:Alkyl hydroperoxide reductase/ Thiol specific antioxidant/ Mal allergen [Chlorobium ferrooxidans DSM 13031]|uniref:Alkyl hydroperoxide reductase/ Thiol specific antioxidant/ Mal allergen n=2 Tax=Chlorobium TaxID=1091 RepID=Q0YQM1_9CHLB|nr:Alkyl hydroperoxide reductase/ Thiol specific antioxidant/ Mal allergen [Chlorobium ferrooxidans DSM 13031]